ncbi:MAG: hypothetical protein K1X92_00485 [Bacteroidia bacterium]|nr:hypothetical protein [Bacteroidia bacterium]
MNKNIRTGRFTDMQLRKNPHTYWLLAIPLLLIYLNACKSEAFDWEEIYQEPEGKRLNKIYFLNDSVGYAVGGFRYTSDIMLKTKDGGETWDSIPQPDLSKSIYDIDFVNDEKGFASCLDGKILATTNGGENWQMLQMGRWFHLNAIDYFSDTLAITAGGDGYGYGIIHRMGQKGYWEPVDTFPFAFRDIQILTPKIAYVCGYGVIMKTEDAGYSWKHTPAENDFFSAIHFITPETGYAVGRTGTILKTQNGGESWEILRNGNTLFKERLRLNDVYFTDTQTGYIVGDKGLFCKTTDGGQSWIKIDKYSTKNLTSLFMMKENQGFLTTSDGQILKFKE